MPKTDTLATPQHFTRGVLNPKLTCAGNPDHHPSRQHPHWFKVRVAGKITWYCKDCLPEPYRALAFVDAMTL